MRRRRFLESCAAISGAAGLGALPTAWADAPPRLYARARLVDVHGEPLRASTLAAETNYVFHFPFAGTPCFLLNLGHPVIATTTLRREDGATYGWNGGVGPSRGVVAFSAICAHKHSSSRLISTLEGGYALSALGRSVTEHIREILAA